MARLLIERGSPPVLIDDHVETAAAQVEAALSTALPVLPPDRVEWGGLDVVVRSPGVSRYRDELAAAESAGVSVTTATAVWLEDYHAAPVLAITGTKGKSTTAALAASILEHLGLSVALVGNIGEPVTDLYGRDPVDAYVAEVSSYQAADVTVSPGVCVLTSLAPDHLDWHGGVETYYRDKLRLITAGPPGLLAVNAGSPEAVRRTADHPHRTLFGASGRVRVESSGMITVDGEAVLASDRLRVPGEHNVANLCGAIAGVLLLQGEPPSAEAVAAAVDGYVGLPSRCRTVGERDGLTFVDDVGLQPVRHLGVGGSVPRARPHRHPRRGGSGGRSRRVGRCARGTPAEAEGDCAAAGSREDGGGTAGRRVCPVGGDRRGS